MNKKLQKQLLNKYPKLFHSTRECPLTERGIECNLGWYDILDNLSEYIQQYIDWNKCEQIYFVQIKEKLSSLRIYHEPHNPNLQLLIDYTSFLSSKTCEDCGTTEKVTTNKKGWMRTLCAACRKEHNKEKI